MLMCKGNGCNWKNICSRYVLGSGIAGRTDISADWMDHCLHRQQQFVRIGSDEKNNIINGKKNDKSNDLQNSHIKDD